MNAIPSPSRFDEILEAAKRKPLRKFEPCGEGILRHDGGRTTLLTLAQVEALAALYRREQLAAEAEASRCHALWSELEAVRCEAVDRCGARV